MSGREIEIPSSFGKLAAIEWGPSNGVPVLAVHGWQDNALSFQPLVKVLPSHLHVISMEMVGFGYSCHLGKRYPYTYLQNVFCVLDVVNWFKWDKFSLIGHSAGAIVGIAFAALFPGRVENLMTLDILYPHVFVTAIKNLSATDGVASFLKLDAKEFASTSKPCAVSWEEAIEIYSKPRKNLSRKNVELLLQRSTRPSKTQEGMYEFTRDYRTNLADWFTYDRVASDQIMNEMANFRGTWLAIMDSNDELAVNGATKDIRQVTKEHTANCKSFQVIKVDTNTHYFHMEIPEVIAPYIKEVLCKKVNSKL